MGLTKEEKAEIVSGFGDGETDTGASAVQVALLTRRITELTEHFRTHPKDHASRHGLHRMVGQRRRLMGYLSRTDAATYRDLLEKLNLRK
jgi:small subunit ribosomal protein S15